MCFGSTLSYPHKEFFNPCLPRTGTKYNLHPPCSKFNPHLPRTRMQSSAGSCTCPATTGTRNLSGLTRPAQDSSTYLVEFSRSRIFEAARTFFEVRTIGGRGRSGACHTQLHSLSPFYWQRDDDAATRHNLIGQYLLFYYCV